MGQAAEVLAQLSPSSVGEVVLFATPKNSRVKIYEIVVCNRVNKACSFRLALVLAGHSTESKDFIYYDYPIKGNDSVTIPLEIDICSHDSIRVHCDAPTLTFTLLGCKN